MKQWLKKLFLCAVPLLWALVLHLQKLKEIFHIPRPYDYVFIEPYSFVSIGVMLLFIWFVYGKSLRESMKAKVYFFGMRLPLIPLQIFIVLLLFGSFIFPFTQPPVKHIVQIAIIGSILEELFTRSFFIKFRGMKQMHFFGWAVIASTLFFGMHWLGAPNFFVDESWQELGLRFIKHFTFAMSAAFLIYKTHRIEIPIMVHMLKNLSIFLTRYSEFWFPASQNLIVLLQLVLIAGCTFKDASHYED